MELATIKTLSGTSPRKFIYNAKKANELIAELEAMLASKNAATLPASSAVAPTVAAKPEVTGRARFNASVSADAARKPAAQSHPGLSGREKFTAAARVDSTPQILSAAGTPETAGAKSEKTGRARFSAAVAVKQ